MYSIKFDTDIIKGVELMDINLLNPHEKIIKKKKTKLTKFIKSFDEYYIISSILCCHKSHVIIDGHHRYFALKELGIEKIPVTMINYFSDKIITDKTDSLMKHDIIENALNGKLYDPKSTKHLIYCEKRASWFPITLISALFELKLN